MAWQNNTLKYLGTYVRNYHDKNQVRLGLRDRITPTVSVVIILDRPPIDLTLRPLRWLIRRQLSSSILSPRRFPTILVYFHNKLDEFTSTMNFKLKKIVSWAASPSSEVRSGPSDLLDILDEAEVGDFTLIDLHGVRYILLLQQCNAPFVSWTSEDAANMCLEASRRGRQSAVCFFQTASNTTLEDMPGGRRAICLSLLSFSDPAISSLGSLQQDETSLREETSWLPRQKAAALSRKGLWILRTAIGLACLIAGVVLLSLLFLSQNRLPQFWQRYGLGSSAGPQFQLQFDHHNVSAWGARYPEPNNEWFVRIDDQAMVRPSLVDAHELRYQRWFRQRYPEADAIRVRGDYLKKSFLGDPSAIQVPADKEFHMAHCVLAVRRYWRARETGKHVCPRDIDFKHMQHCLDALDMWAFPEGPRRSVPAHGAMKGHMPQGVQERQDNQTTEDGGLGSGKWRIDESDKTRLVWRTKVCFNSEDVDAELA